MILTGRRGNLALQGFPSASPIGDSADIQEARSPSPATKMHLHLAASVCVLLASTSSAHPAYSNPISMHSKTDSVPSMPNFQATD